jgi:hypothetical protein
MTYVHMYYLQAEAKCAHMYLQADLRGSNGRNLTVRDLENALVLASTMVCHWDKRGVWVRAILLTQLCPPTKTSWLGTIPMLTRLLT